MRQYEVNCNWGQIVEAENEAEAERIFWQLFDNSFLKADINEIKMDVEEFTDQELKEEYEKIKRELQNRSIIETKKITIPLSEEDLQELLNGKTFDWTFDSVDCHLKLEDEGDL